ncbi:hypothetical protein TNCV_3813131 [Trichonephila clavipes]|nr:hypothetical protein TNCV_3813131 [Trichonephila clavipes]
MAKKRSRRMQTFSLRARAEKPTYGRNRSSGRTTVGRGIGSSFRWCHSGRGERNFFELFSKKSPLRRSSWHFSHVFDLEKVGEPHRRFDFRVEVPSLGRNVRVREPGPVFSARFGEKIKKQTFRPIFPSPHPSKTPLNSEIKAEILRKWRRATPLDGRNISRILRTVGQRLQVRPVREFRVTGKRGIPVFATHLETRFFRPDSRTVRPISIKVTISESSRRDGSKHVSHVVPDPGGRTPGAEGAETETEP